MEAMKNITRGSGTHPLRVVVRNEDVRLGSRNPACGTIVKIDAPVSYVGSCATSVVEVLQVGEVGPPSEGIPERIHETEPANEVKMLPK